jgi:hypothetical protein
MLNCFDAGVDAVHVWDLSLYEKADIVVRQRAKELLAKLDLDGWAVILDETQEVIEAIMRSGVYEALFQIGLSEDNITKLMAEKAVEYAKKRGAELVGKRLLDDGTIIENPKSKWAISENTRKLLQGDVERAITEGMSTDQLKDVVMDNYAFSEERAEMIARTETAFADARGNMIAYQESGVVKGKKWILASNHPEDDECDTNAAQGVIPLDEPFESGDMEPPLHPNCLCDVVPVLAEMEET